jgi:hypothetical protein
VNRDLRVACEKETVPQRVGEPERQRKCIDPGPLAEALTGDSTTNATVGRKAPGPGPGWCREGARTRGREGREGGRNAGREG